MYDIETDLASLRNDCDEDEYYGVAIIDTQGDRDRNPFMESWSKLTPEQRRTKMDRERKYAAECERNHQAGTTSLGDKIKEAILKKVDRQMGL